MPVNDQAIMAKSFADTLDLVDRLLDGKFDPVDTDRARAIVLRFRRLIAKSNALHQQIPGA